MLKLLVLLSYGAVFVLAQDVNTLAQYIYDNDAVFFKTYELVRIAQKIQEQACSGASVQQIFDNFQQTVSYSIGGSTAANLIALFQKLQQDLGGEFEAVKNAASQTGVDVFTPVLNDLTQYCGEGAASVFYHANAYCSYDFGKYIFDTAYQALAGVSWNAWSICRYDLDQALRFANYGY